MAGDDFLLEGCQCGCSLLLVDWEAGCVVGDGHVEVERGICFFVVDEAGDDGGVGVGGPGDGFCF